MDASPVFDRKIRLKNIFLPVLLFIIAILQIFFSIRAWEIMLITFGCMLVLSAVWAYALLRGLSFNRHMRHSWAQVGDKFFEHFTISNKSRFPALAVTLFDHSTFPGYNSSVAYSVKGNFDKLWYMDSVCYTRGLYKLGPTKIRTSDPFGVFEVTITSNLEKEILVTPPIVPLLQIDIAAGEWQGDGGSKTAVLERTVTAGSVREYVPGDSIYSVHWLTSARRGNLFVRTFDKNPSTDWWIFLDMDRYVQVGEGMKTTDEYATVLAASIADRGLKENRQVGLIAEGTKTLWLSPKTGTGQRTEIMYALALVNRGDKPLSSLLADAQPYLSQKSSAIIITPSLNSDWLGALSALKQRGVVTTVLHLDPKEFGGAESSSAILSQIHAWGIQYFSIDSSIYQQKFAKSSIPNHGVPPDREYKSGAFK